MADLNKGSGDWTAGIIAIVATLLLGAAVPVGLYFALYKPKTVEHAQKDEEFNKVSAEFEVLVARQTDVTKMEKEADETAKKLAKLEEVFAVPNDDAVIARIAKLATSHDIKLLEKRRGMLDVPDVVFPPKTPQPVAFKHGLQGRAFFVEGEGTYHDFGRFMADLENYEKTRTVVVVERVRIEGSRRAGPIHQFYVKAYIFEKRNIAEIGRNVKLPAKQPAAQPANG